VQVRNYTYQDIITVSPAMSEYEKKIKIFFEEHIHDDEEIRYILDGSGVLRARSLPGMHSWHACMWGFESLMRERIVCFTQTWIITVRIGALGCDSRILCYGSHPRSIMGVSDAMDAAGYFDVRSPEDKWLRIACGKGDMIVLPAGMYHRFTLDENNYIKVLLVILWLSGSVQ
jgi:cupin superfamily acireductone dioxygenase involved in methionine salvage